MMSTFFYVLLFIYLFLAVLGLSCCERGLFSSYGAMASHCSGFSCCGAWAVECAGSVVVA